MPTWHAHPDVWFLLGGVWVAYLLAVRRHGSSAPDADRRERRRRTTLFSAGMGLLWFASEWPMHDLAEGYLYSAHMVQHMVYTLVAAPLLVAGIPAWMWRAILRPRPIGRIFGFAHAARRRADRLQRGAPVHPLARGGRGVSGLGAAALLPARADRVVGGRDVVAGPVSAPGAPGAPTAGADAVPVPPVARADDPGIVPHVRSDAAIPRVRNVPADLGDLGGQRPVGSPALS